ncbi:MAG: hypothetical protein JWQ16_524 [Novosphingobium sp.]|nr:hypothetical protein [Novosphingobium sp.]
MTRRTGILLAVLLAACDQSASGAGAAPLVYNGPFVLGVQTHFGQNWPDGVLPLAIALPSPFLRDGLSWTTAEVQKGQIAFPPQKLGPLRSACRAGAHLVLTANPRNPLYDANMIVSSPEGVAAFLAYLRALVSALPAGCVDALEIGNEVNGARALPVAPGRDPLATYAALLRAVYAPFKQAAPGVAILGGSTNVIGTGFLDRLFAKGLLDNVDGIAVHPYRDHAENLDWELRRLSAVMAARGKQVPIWATEFGDYFKDPADAAPALVKLVTVLSATGVERASWYALMDQKWFLNMGLFGDGKVELPAGRAFSLVQRELIPHGRAERIPSGATTYLYRYGADRWVVWGAPSSVTRDAGSRYLDAEGRVLSGELTVGANPLIVVGKQPVLGPSPILADSLLQFESAPWSYFGRTASGRLVPLTALDSQFATTLGNAALRPLFLSDMSGAATGTAASPTGILIRYTAPAAMAVQTQVCLTANPKGDGLHVTLSAGGKPVAEQLVTASATILTKPVTLASADPVELAIGPGGAAGRGNTFRYRIRMFRAGAEVPACTFPIAAWGQP